MRRLPAVALALCLGCTPPPEKPVERFGFTPRWAYQPWISKDISTGADTFDFVGGFEARDIPVGVVVLDSPWETDYNTFIPNPSRYPDFEAMVENLHGRNVRTVLWITQMLNDGSFDLEVGGDTYAGPADGFNEAKRRGLFVNDGTTSIWWKGTGGGIDFFNDEAKTFWHAKQERVLKVIDGWKLDFGEEYLRTGAQLMTPATDVIVKTKQGDKTLQQYSEAYYEDFLTHGRAVRGDQFLTMVRPYDASYGFPGRFFAKKEHTPIGWVGDNRRDWLGLQDALDHIFRSAKAGYVTISSDLGGYLDVDDLNVTGPKIPFSQTNFARWTAMSAMSPFMQLHGRGNLAPWTVPERADETVTLYRYWAKLHVQLVPYLYSTGEAAYRGKGEVTLRPVGDEASWPNDYRYHLGNGFLIAPILDDTGRRDVPLPADARYFSWWDEVGTPLNGGTTLSNVDSTDRARIPIYVKEGAIIVADVKDGSTRLGTSAHAGMLTVLTWPGPSETSFTVYEDTSSYAVTVRKAWARPASDGQVKLDAVKTGAFVQVWSDSPPTSVSLNGAALTARASKDELDGAADGFFVVPATKFFWVKVPAKASGAATVTWN
ncbi:MAG: glycoside hydrolase family 31 protein [Myxococcales bacterium]|nr:glycoside hydrolase family 31 protein [Myxococcales bacterium]